MMTQSQTLSVDAVDAVDALLVAGSVASMVLMGLGLTMMSDRR